MRKVLSMLLCVAMLLTMLPTVAFASTSLVFEANTSEIGELAEGDEVAIPVKIASNPGFFAAKIYVSFDESIFEFVKMVKGTELDGSYTINKNEYSCTYDREDTGDEETSMTTATPDVFVTITLKVKSGAAAGETQITVTGEATDYNFATVDVAEASSVITIAGAEEEVKPGYYNGKTSLTFNEIKADDYTLTAPGEGNYYFAGWFKGLTEGNGITKTEAGHYVLSAGTASGTSYTITESRPKYDEIYDDTAIYNALWVYDDGTSSDPRAMLLGVVDSTVTFYSTTGDDTTLTTNTSVLLTEKLVAVNTTGYIKLLHDISITGLVLDNGETYVAGCLDLNGNTLTTSGAIKVYNAGNVYESSYGKGEVISTASDSVFLTVNAKNSRLTLRDLKITAKSEECCVEIKRDARLESMVRCELTSTGASTVYLYGRKANPASVGTIDSCTIRAYDAAGINIYNASNQSIDMISNTTIISDTQAQVIKNVGTITFGENNTVVGENSACLIDGGTVNFTAVNGTYQVASNGIIFDDDVTVAVPEGFVCTENEGKLSFIKGYQVVYMDYTGTAILYVENVPAGQNPTGSYVVTYPNEQLTAYHHAGWAAEVNGTVITDFSAYASATTFYAVRTSSTLEAAVTVTNGSNTYQYASLDEAFAAFTNSDIADAADTTVTFTLLADAEATVGIISKNSSVVLDVNGHTLNYIGNADTAHPLIDDQGETSGRTITLKSSAEDGKIHGDLNAVALVQQNSCMYAANVRVENLNVTTDMTGKGEFGDKGSDMSIVALGTDPFAMVYYTIVNSSVDTFYNHISVATSLSEGIMVTLENTSMRSATGTVVDAPGSVDMTVSLDSKSKVKADMYNTVLVGTVMVPEGYTFGDTDGDGWWKAECNHATWNEATCTAPKTCGTCGATEGNALGHTYGPPVFAWNATTESATCTATFTCTVCAEGTDGRIATESCAVTENRTLATCGAAGSVTYTATINFNNTEYTNNSEAITIPATGAHNWVNGYCDSCKTTCLHESYGEDGKCTMCGMEKPAGEPELFEIPYTNIRMGVNLSLMFYVKVSDIGNNTDGVVAVLETTYADSRGTVTTTIPYSTDTWKTSTVSNIQYYVIELTGLAAKEMNDNITMHVTRNGAAISETKVASIKTYCESALNKDTTNEKLKIALVDMLNYGAAAQVQFDYNTSNPANAGLTDDQKAMATLNLTLEQSRSVVSGADYYYASNARFVSDITIMFYVLPSTNGTRGEITFTDHYGNEKTVSTEEYATWTSSATKIQYRIYEFSGLVVADASQMVTFKLYDAENNVVVEVQDSLHAYAKRTAESETASASMKELADAYMKFATSAHAYLHRDDN